MKDKTQYEALMEELKKLANNFKDVVTELGDILAKILPDVEIPDEDAWEMKCPYKYGDEHYCIQSNGYIFLDSWHDIEADNSFFSQGNIFPTKQAAELEAKRRNLLTRFRAFRDECNGDWKPDWTDSFTSKYLLSIIDSKLVTDAYWYANKFNTFGYFKNEKDAERAIELFGDEIKELFMDCEEE
nr:MAG TPA: hypothetical protein [Caudoviricetes sp.]